MSKRRLVELSWTNRGTMAVFGVANRPTRYYHDLTPESMVRLTRVAETLVMGGTWTATPWNVPVHTGHHIGWSMKPYRW